ncbi:tetratricopeptide repeat protein [Rhodalgimonas zhirmunskyi]|uniref:Tetratricopeptide repeat protein 38 n=1 Tax=Rhodalgimonas zhirmunskyi TaxID=2964767 RepID=A0AAJ1U348_9RHOB|nr:tetratricopeptide repeat protein [Rhodoalgimonas zhirmunskyi]MDQ2092836.1 tetratricopeptide repeat protein [Rhodoalgimonas zhirmunskyi]
MQDHYGNPLHTTSQTARDGYNAAFGAYLEAQPGVEDALERALAADPEFAQALMIRARNHHSYSRMTEAKADITRAMALRADLPNPARAQIEIFDHLIHGRTAEGYARIRAHLLEHPRDALVAQTCLGVFSLIGFSGQPGREAEHLAVAEALAPAYGDDGWFQGQLAFAQMEAGQLKPAEASITAALEQTPRSGHASHIRAHLFYEMGETAEGLAYLTEWMAQYDRAGLMHCHNSWHIALWALAQGDEARMWAVVDDALLPEVTQSPKLNVLTDLASLYWRAGLKGVEVPSARWRALAEYAAQTFPQPALGFADVHVALAHAMTGQDEALARIVEGAKGPAADIVAPCAAAFGHVARGQWGEAEAALIPVMVDHARLGGSRAQRDLIEHTMLQVLIRQGKADEARRLLAMRRPTTDSAGAVAGLAA